MTGRCTWRGKWSPKSRIRMKVLKGGINGPDAPKMQALPKLG